MQYKERRVGCNGRGLLQEANPASGVDTVANGQQSRVQHMRLLSHRKGGSGWVGGNMEYHVFFYIWTANKKEKETFPVGTNYQYNRNSITALYNKRYALFVILKISNNGRVIRALLRLQRRPCIGDMRLAR